MTIEILDTEPELDALAAEWQALHQRSGKSPFSDYDWFNTWWQKIGRTTGRLALHLIVGRENQQLVGVLPLIRANRNGISVLQAAGQNSFYYCDLVSDNETQAAQLWDAARRSPGFVFADIRDVYPESECHRPLSGFARKRDAIDSFALNLRWASGEEWLSSLSGNTRGNFRRCSRRLDEMSPLDFHVHVSTESPPPHVVDSFVKDKVSWCRRRNKSGLFDHPGVGEFFRTMATGEAARNRLFLTWLTCGDDIAATILGLRHRDILHLPFWTYDDRFARYSPGNVLMVNVIQWAIDEGFRRIDFRQGKSSFKVKYANETRSCDEYTFAPSLPGRLVEAGFIGTRALWRQFRRGDSNEISEARTQRQAPHAALPQLAEPDPAPRRS